VERIWETGKTDVHHAKFLSESLGIHELLASLLIARGIQDEQEARDFLYPMEAGLHDPFLLTDMDLAVERIVRAIDRKEGICIFGHEDVDGITATVTLLETLRDIGAVVSYYILNRAEEGHSLSRECLDKVRRRGPSLLVTVDCSVTGQDVVGHARAHGVDIIVTDHHEVTKQLSSLIHINCKKDIGRYPNPSLSGVGVAHKLAQATAERKLGITSAQWESAKEELLVLVLFGTIADRGRLVGENRTLAVRGEKMLLQSGRMAIRVLAEKGFGRRIDSVMAQVVPVLSSARSRDGYNVGCEFLMTPDYDEGVRIFMELRELSDQWYAESRRMYDKVRTQVDPTARLITVVDKDISPYHLGYCANRLKEEFSRPAIVISLKERGYIGEGRSTKSFDLVDLLTHCNDLLIDYGGHKQAAGFSIGEKEVQVFTARAKEYADSHIEWNDLVRKILIDLKAGPGDLGDEVRTQLKLFSPYGEGNREPTFLMENVTLREIYADHVTVERDDASASIRTSGSKGKWVSLSGQPVRIDCVVAVDREGELHLVDSRPSFA